MNEIKIKRIVNLLIVLQFVIFMQIFVSKSNAADEFSLTPSQKHFTSIVRGLPGIISVTWDSPISMWMKVSSRAVGSPASVDRAQKLAKTMADRGKSALRQPLCVHIYQTKSKELAKSCVFF